MRHDAPDRMVRRFLYRDCHGSGKRDSNAGVPAYPVHVVPSAGPAGSSLGEQSGDPQSRVRVAKETFLNKKRDHPKVISSLERKTRLELATPTLARIAAPRSKKAPPFQTYQLSYFRRVDYQQIRGFRFIQNPIFTCMIFTRKRTGVNIGVKVQTSFAVNNS